MKKQVFVAMLWLCFCLSGCGRNKGQETEAAHRELFAMNTYITINAYGENTEEALDAAQDCIGELESLWSVTDVESEIYRLNHNEGVPLQVCESTAELIQFALAMAEKTDGALDPTIYPVLTAWGFTTDSHRIPAQEEISRLLQSVDYKEVSVDGRTVLLPEGMQIDLGAVAKGFAGDEITDVMRDKGVESALISLGGNIQAVGTKPDGEPWRIGIRSPENTGNFAVLEVSECAVVTSGGYQNFFTGEDGKVYHHILAPHTGEPAENGLLSATVIGTEGKLCDALSTALFVMGEEKAAEYWQENSGFEMVLYTEQDEVIITEGLEDAFRLNEGYEELSVRVLRR